MADRDSALREHGLGRADLHPGSSTTSTPEAELGRYRMRGGGIFKKIPHWRRSRSCPAPLTRFVIEGYREKCETGTVLGARFAKKPLELDIPVYIGAVDSVLAVVCLTLAIRNWPEARRWPARRPVR
ncbi:hypothetical protein HBB16_15390 [Pseudonocardia sp. MCCB 268]|nr:hypothetical protein [Pseudonocardia cytotoxica]